MTDYCSRVKRGHSFKPLVAAVLLAWMPLAQAIPIAQMEMKASDGVVRFSLEAPAGMLLDAGTTGRGESLELRLKEAERDDILRHIGQLKQNPLFKGARILPSEAGEVRLLLEFSQPVSVIDETIVALPGKVSRWEVVVGAGKQAVAKAPAPALARVEAEKRDGRIDVTLSGNLGLVAEASFLDSPPRLVVDLPGVPTDQAASAAAGFYAEAGLIKSVRAMPMPGVAAGGARLELELTEAADLIDTFGQASDKQGQVVLSLVPDAAAGKARDSKLGALGFEVKEGNVQMRLIGVSGSRISAYTIEEPPRLVVDFLGWHPDQVKEALAGFGAQSMATLGAPRLDVTRLGSARAVFDLAASAPFRTAKAVRLPVDGNPGVFADNLLISLAPGPVASQTLARRGPLDLRLRRELQDGRQSEVVIRAPVLENGERYAASALRLDSGRDYALVGLFARALESDARYQAAKAEFTALGEAVPQARAGILPTASFDYKRSMVWQDISRAANSSFPTGRSDYNDSSLSLTITQPLYKPQARIKMSQAEISVEQARLSLLAAEQDLILRVASAYLALLAANDGVELARAERQSMDKQHEQARFRLDRGLGTISQVQDTEARLSLTRAKEIEAENRVDDARLALKEIVGENVASVRGFKGDFDATLPLPTAIEPWVDASLDQNLALKARASAVEIAALEVKRQRAGHLPTLALTGSLSRQDADDSIYGQGQKSDNADVGLRFSLPLTDGGLTSSLVREALARKDKAEFEREQELRRTERFARSSYNGVVTSAKSLAALRQSVVAQESALETRLEGYKAGLFSVVAVMDAYRLYYAAQRDFLQARYDYLLNRLKLKQAVGNLSRGDLEDIAALLQ